MPRLQLRATPRLRRVLGVARPCRGRHVPSQRAQPRPRDFSTAESSSASIRKPWLKAVELEGCSGCASLDLSSREPLRFPLLACLARAELAIPNRGSPDRARQALSRRASTSRPPVGASRHLFFASTLGLHALRKLALVLPAARLVSLCERRLERHRAASLHLYRDAKCSTPSSRYAVAAPPPLMVSSAAPRRQLPAFEISARPELLQQFSSAPAAVLFL